MRFIRWAGVLFAAGALAPAAWAGGSWLIEDSCACGGQVYLLSAAYLGDGLWACYYGQGSQWWVVVYQGTRCPG